MIVKDRFNFKLYLGLHIIHSQRQYSSQLSLKNIAKGQCFSVHNKSHEDLKPCSRFSRRRYLVLAIIILLLKQFNYKMYSHSRNDDAYSDPLKLSKTAWPVPTFEVIFLPEFPINETSLINSYAIINIISKGAYGKVYKVQKKETKDIFALKTISKAKIVSEDAIKQAKQESSILQAVGHHNFIVNSPDRWQGRKALFILTKFITGGELFSLVEEYGSLSEEIVRIYVAEVALALDFLHNAGIIHRDLKASNVLLDSEGHVVLIDFGLAKWLRPLERTLTFCGTFEYMAPEIIKRKCYGHEVDWWSLGVLMCFLLTKKFPGKNITRDLLENGELAIVTFGSLPDEVDNISLQAIDLLKRLLQPEPKMRIKSILGLQRIAFYMNHDVRSYYSKKVSPFNLLGKKIENAPIDKEKNVFLDFDSYMGINNAHCT
uniref:Protein kinase domain-containing protein n=1 Tax=Trichogramma kaykai TaxID=54128 RepID=A0ABD2WJQ7_9HYME